MSPQILITGATGKQGHAVITQLLSHSVPPSSLHALTRNLTSPASLQLSSLGVTLHQGSLDDEFTLLQALTNIDAAFLVNADGPNELIQAKRFIDLAVELGLPFLVYGSAEGCDVAKGVGVLEGKAVVEQYLKESGLDHAILRPVSFYDNFPKEGGISRWAIMGLFDKVLEGKKLQMVACADIGWFATQALLHPKRYSGQTISIAGDNLAMTEAARLAGAWKAPWWFGSLALLFLPKDLKDLFKWFNETGYNVDLAKVREEHPGVLSFEAWLKSSKK